MAAIRRKPKSKALAGALALARQVSQYAASDLWMSFDKEADVLYLSFQRPQQATRTVELDDGGILAHYRDRKLVGITVLNASDR